MTTRTDNVECYSKWAKKLLRWIDRGSRSITVSPSSSNFFFELAKVATLQHTFERDLIQNLATEAEFAALLFFSSFWPKSFRREKPAFSRGQTSSKKKLVRRRSLFLVHTLLPLLLSSSTTITIYHKLNVRTSRFFFRSQFSRTTFFATFSESRQSPNFACGPRVADIALNFPVGFLRQFHLEEDPPPLSFFPLHLAGPVG